MKARVIKILVALVVLGFFGWIGSKLEFREATVPLPLKGEAATNPFYAAIHFIEELGGEAAWERVFVAPPRDSVIVLSTWNWTLSRGRRERIQRWVEGGGRLVVDQTLIGGFEEFETWSGITELDLSKAKQDDDEEEESEESEDKSDGAGRKRNKRRPQPDEDERAILERLLPKDCGTLTEDVTKRELQVCSVDESRSLTSSRKTTWALREGTAIHALRVPVGRGSVTVINASPFRFRDFFDGDHPMLFVLATQLRHGDDVLFLTEEEHASVLTLFWRFATPVVLLLLALIVLALWRAGARFGPPIAPAESARRSLTEQIRGTGRFALRFGGGRALHAATVRALRDAAIREFPGYDRLSSEERIETISRATGVPVTELGPALNYAGARSPHELRQAIAVLEAARRRILLKNKRSKHGN